MDSADIQLLHTGSRKHVEATGSPRGEWILENWAAHAAEIRQGFPARIQACLPEREEPGIGHDPTSVKRSLGGRSVPVGRASEVIHG